MDNEVINKTLDIIELEITPLLDRNEELQKGAHQKLVNIIDLLLIIGKYYEAHYEVIFNLIRCDAYLKVDSYMDVGEEIENVIDQTLRIDKIYEKLSTIAKKYKI